MPTIRSYYSLDQFREVIHKLAHGVALNAVKNLNQGDVRIVIRGPKLSVVDTDKVKIRFYAKHIGYYEEPTRSYKDWWGFDVEAKPYLTSNHCSKISFFVTANQDQKKKAEKITKFIDKIMADAGIKPIPRFKLADIKP